MAYDMVVILTGLSISSGPDRVLKVVQDADTQTLLSLAQLFNIVPGDDPNAYETAILSAILEVFAAVLASPPFHKCPSYFCCTTNSFFEE